MDRYRHRLTLVMPRGLADVDLMLSAQEADTLRFAAEELMHVIAITAMQHAPVSITIEEVTA